MLSYAQVCSSRTEGEGNIGASRRTISREILHKVPWAEENKHLPNLQNSEQIIDRFRKQWEARKNQQQSLDGRVTSIEQKLDKLMNHLGVK